MTKYIERIILATFLVLLIAVAVGFAYTFPKLSDIVKFSDNPRGGLAKKLDEGKLTSSLETLKSPAIWKDNSHRLFNSVDVLFYPSLYPNEQFLKVIDLGKTGPGGPVSPGAVPLSWYIKYHINYADKDVDTQDPDKDGWSNISEYKNEQVGERLNAKDLDGSKATDPTDPNSHPPYLARLRLKQYESRPFKLTFNSYQSLGSNTLFQIHIDGVSSDQQPGLLKTGDPLKFENQVYIIGAFKLNIVTKMDPAIKEEIQEDDSTVDLIEPDLNDHITLPLHKVTDAPESTADFVMLLPQDRDQTFKIRKGKILKIKEIPDQEFQVVNVDDNGATIRDTQTKKDYPVLKWQQSDQDEMPAD